MQGHYYTYTPLLLLFLSSLFRKKQQQQTVHDCSRKFSIFFFSILPLSFGVSHTMGILTLFVYCSVKWSRHAVKYRTSIKVLYRFVTCSPFPPQQPWYTAPRYFLQHFLIPAYYSLAFPLSSVTLHNYHVTR